MTLIRAGTVFPAIKGYGQIGRLAIVFYHRSSAVFNPSGSGFQDFLQRAAKILLSSFQLNKTFFDRRRSGAFVPLLPVADESGTNVDHRKAPGTGIFLLEFRLRGKYNKTDPKPGGAGILMKKKRGKEDETASDAEIPVCRFRPDSAVPAPLLQPNRSMGTLTRTEALPGFWTRMGCCISAEPG